MKIANDIQTIQQHIQANKLSLLYVKAPNCGVCTVFRKQVGEILATLPTIAGIETDIRQVPEIATYYHILTAPAVLFFAEGKEIFRSARYINMAELRERLVQYSEVYG
ncbi:thioredoxin family protein [Bibersteinia trehalosi]|nr:thioredoxin family protein [Bibersteinia trehalosi]